MVVSIKAFCWQDCFGSVFQSLLMEICLIKTNVLDKIFVTKNSLMQKMILKFSYSSSYQPQMVLDQTFRTTNKKETSRVITGIHQYLMILPKQLKNLPYFC